MSEVVNLRMARKAKRRTEADTQASANRLRYGRTLGQRAEETMASDRARRVLDGARRTSGEIDGSHPDPDHGG